MPKNDSKTHPVNDTFFIGNHYASFVRSLALLISVILLMNNHQDREVQKMHYDLKSNLQKRYRSKKRESLPQVNGRSSARQQVLPESKNDLRGALNSNRTPSKQEQNKSSSNKLNSTLNHLNFSHHSEDSCLCNDCTCGRHLCKLNAIKPSLKKASIYQTNFQPKQLQEAIIVKQKQTSPLKGDHLDLSSLYIKDYASSRSEKLERPRPVDELKFDGPSLSLTTYGTFFPGHRGDNQYVKPTNKHAIGDFPLLSKTVYSTQFVPRKTTKSDYQKQHDSLKTGTNWFGATTYKKSFHMPNPEDYPTKIVSAEKYHKQLNYSHQFQTSYQNEFIEKPSPLCPSRMQLQAKKSNLLQRSKHLFRENSDFKSMSPQFKPISTSKHFYV